MRFIEFEILIDRLFGIRAYLRPEQFAVEFVQNMRVECPTCNGTARYRIEIRNQHGEVTGEEFAPCTSCDGSGKVNVYQTGTISLQELEIFGIQMSQVRRRIGGEIGELVPKPYHPSASTNFMLQMQTELNEKFSEAISKEDLYKELVEKFPDLEWNDIKPKDAKET